MGKFIIVSKNKNGNKSGERYTITYQINGDYERYNIDMYCISTDPVRYCYIAEKYSKYLETEKDRAEFLDELYEFQKGGSYRKTHPITYKKTELIKQEIDKQNDILYKLKQDLEKAEKEERKSKFETYYKDVDIKSLDKYVNKIKSSFEDKRYYVSGIEFNIWEGHRIFIYDRKLDKAVKIITIRDGKVETRNLDECDIKCTN